MQNRVLFAAVIAWMCAQVLKIVLTLITTKKFRAERLWGRAACRARIPRWCAA